MASPHDPVSGSRPQAPRKNDRRASLEQEIGLTIVRFQDASNAFDDAAAEMLALDGPSMRCLSLLLFGGPRSIDALQQLTGMKPTALTTVLDRLELGGYARRTPGKAGRGSSEIALTAHARDWIESIWGPLQAAGPRLLSSYSINELTVIADCLSRALAVEEAQTARLRSQLAVPESRAKPNRKQGGLSPAALRRVHIFVEAKLDQSLRVSDLAERAGLSEAHFAREFRISAGVTPRRFVEQRRIERAQQLIRETEHPLAEIAVMTGFGTQSRLTTAFRRGTGFTPAQYRHVKGA